MPTLIVEISGDSGAFNNKLEEAREYLLSLFQGTDFDSLQVRVTEGVGRSSYFPYQVPRMPVRREPLMDPGAAMHSLDETYVLDKREAAENVLETLSKVLEKFNFVSVGDFKEIIGVAPTYVDNKWGWTSFEDVELKQIRGCWALTLPTPMPLKGIDGDDTGSE